ncbi:Guanine nucleotide-binding protein-like 3-like protein [Astathelohania contejeani]|uniref:Guanine nucleotide-binding protein-like 3-like protein n=1 Tax=Astathelohania contejeani TaxID=164912 RepID=A0ABQ7HZW7_9MICR|nr:Guanine nucleotide-binding protein-like 3-like protein [Thelohania contejeani]
MVVKKRKSRRIPTKRREKIKMNIRAHNRKKKREERKKEKKRAIPPSILRLDEDIQKMEEIKQASLERQKVYEEECKRKEEISKNYREYIVDNSDLIFQMIDARDPLESRDHELENLINEKKKEIGYVICHRKDASFGFCEWLDEISNNIKIYDLEDDISNISELCASKIISIAGHQNSGKALFLARLREINEKTRNFIFLAEGEEIKNTEGKVTVIRKPYITPVEKITISKIIRGVIKNINFKSFMKAIINQIEKSDLLKFYEISDFENLTEFYKLMKEKFGNISKLEEKVIRDIKMSLVKINGKEYEIRYHLSDLQ